MYIESDSPGNRMKWLMLCVLVMSLFTSSMAWSAVGNTDGVRLAEGPMAVGDLIQAVIGLIVVLVMIFGGAFLLRRYGRFQAGADGALKVIGGISLGARERLVLVQVGDEQLLLGVSPGRIAALHRLEQPVALARPASERGDRFADRLLAAMKQRKPL